MDLTRTLRLYCPSQLPPHFQIVALTKEIVSWLTSMLQKLPVKEQLWEAPTKTMLGRFNVGPNTSHSSDLDRTPSSTSLAQTTATSPYVPLPAPSGKADFQASLTSNWLREQSAIPYQIYAQPLGKTADKTLPKTKTFSHASLYNNNFVPTKTKILKKSNIRQFPSVTLPRLQNAKQQNCN